MANYPTLSQLESIESGNPYQQTLNTWRAADGTARGRDLGAGNKLDFPLVYPAQSAADWALILAHYVTDFESSFSFSSVFTGSSHTVKYAAPPSRSRPSDYPSGKYLTKVRLVEV